MKEISLFTLASSVHDTIQKLGELGVVDIREVSTSFSDNVSRRIEDVERTEKAIAVLNQYEGQKNGPSDRIRYNFKDPKRLTERVLRSLDIKNQVEKRLAGLLHDLQWYHTWGEDVAVRDLRYLREKGIYVRLYLVDKHLVSSIPTELDVITFAENEGKVPVALFARDDSVRLPFKEDTPPVMSIKAIRRQVERKQRQLNELELYWQDQSRHIGDMNDYLDYLRDRLGAQQALEGMGDIRGKVKFLKGYIPVDAVDSFVATADEEAWGYQVSEPEDPEEVPVYVKNPRWISIINPVMKFIDIVPGYREVDVSIYFLVAFALFFAMLVGDAGYGAIFLVLALVLRKKLAPQMRVLIYVLSGATIIWGVMSGTYFGSEDIASIPFLDRLIVDNISSFGVDNISFMMHLSFLIGAIHLTIAHAIRVVQFINSIKALSEIGWIAIMWGLYFVAELLVLQKPMPEWNIWLISGGALLVILFSRESTNFFRSILASIANLPLSLINGFSDVVSYVRLFAVGLATATVAASFNSMIIPDGFGGMSFLGLILAALALFVGHALNIVLALMAVMVHGIRLNMLEFAGHLGVQFSGEAYQPFRLKSSETDMTTTQDIESTITS